MGYIVPINGDDNENYLLKTIVLLGCTGSGKSSTGNTILGVKKFPTLRTSFGRVTTKCETWSVDIPDPDKLESGEKIAGTILNVIDTPGLFDSSSKGEDVLKEIAVCINIARASGLEAVLMVVSLTARFTEEQAAVVDTLKYLFGERIVDYMIVAFTHGDSLEKSGKTLDDRLSSCPKPLKELLRQCGDRKIVFNNKTKDEKKISEKREELVRLIEQTVEKNGGKPYTYELFSQVEKERKESKNDSSEPKKMTDEEMQELIDAEVKERLKKRDDDNINKLKEDLERVKEEAAAKGSQNKILNDEIRELQKRLAKAEKEAAERWSCAVL